jgi:ABC-type branched-subunit amino acid transport system ATPase component
MLLEVTSLEAGYGKLTIVHGVDLHVAPGEIVLLMGPNGAGKTTLLRTISGHLPTKAGRIEVEGEDISAMSAFQRSGLGIGYVPQDNNVFGPLTVSENLAAASLFRPELASRSEEVVDRFPRLAERRSQRASTLSGGERQMLAVGSAMVGEPRLLLLDEPTAGLAPRFVIEIVHWMKEVAAGGCGVIWVVEQNPEAVLEAASRAYFMAGGEITDERLAASLDDAELLRQILFDR